MFRVKVVGQSFRFLSHLILTLSIQFSRWLITAKENATIELTIEELRVSQGKTVGVIYH